MSVVSGMGLQMSFGGDDGRSPEMGLRMPSGRYDRESSEMGLKMPSKKDISRIRDSLARILVPAVKRDFARECSLISWEIEYRSFSCPLLYWGINS